MSFRTSVDSKSDVPPSVNDYAKDRDVGTDCDQEREQPSEKEERENKGSVAPVRGQVVEAATDQVSFCGVSTKQADQRESRKANRENPNDKTDDTRPVSSRLLIYFQRATDDQEPVFNRFTTSLSIYLCNL